MYGPGTSWTQIAKRRLREQEKGLKKALAALEEER